MQLRNWIRLNSKPSQANGATLKLNDNKSQEVRDLKTIHPCRCIHL